MKLLLFILGICIGIVGIEISAKAQNYPWCAQYSGDGSMNCGFATFSAVPDRSQWNWRVLHTK